MSISMIDLVVPNGWTRNKLIHMKHFHNFFSSKFQHIRMISVSGHCVPFIFETCQTFMGISINYATRTISRFFKTCISADFLQFGLIVSRVIKILTQLKHLLLMKMKCRHPLNSENFHYNFLIELPP